MASNHGGCFLLIPAPAPLALTRYLRLSENARAVFFLGRTGDVPSHAEPVGNESEDHPSLHYPVSTARTMLSKKASRMGDKAKPSGVSATADGFAVCLSALHEKNRAAHRSGPKFTGCTADRSDGAVLGKQ